MDNLPFFYAFNNYNGLPVTSYFDDKNYKELSDMTISFVFLSKINDVKNLDDYQQFNIYFTYYTFFCINKSQNIKNETIIYLKIY